MMTDLLDIILTKRGITDPAVRAAFLNPDYALHTHDPLKLKGAHKAAERIIKAIKGGETIAIFSDYDADGIPGAVVFTDFLKRVKAANPEFTFSTICYIPDRHEEGFGLSIDAIDELKWKGAQVIITIDCGIADVVPVAHAKTLGIDLIITDHHLPGPALPDAYAIVNPKQVDCEYPEKMLCGSGVAFKLIQAILATDRLNIKEGQEKWLLDMVGIATLSDMVPLTGENRVFAKFGLQVMRKSPRLGFMRLLKETKVAQKYLSEDDIAFMITPRINAASRMGSATDAFKLLSTDDEIEAGMLAKRLQELNDERKSAVATITKEAKKKLAAKGRQVTGSEGEKSKVIVLGDPEWRPSLLGLVANSLAEEYKCPVFLWGREGGDVIKGSCRSDGSVSVVDIMHSVPEGTFIGAGGHHMAGGFSVNFDSVHNLEATLEKAFETAASKAVPLAALADAELSIEDVNEGTWRIIEQVGPYGFGNPKPLFIFKHAVINSARQFGKQMNHLELSFDNFSGRGVKAIAFFSSPEDFADNFKNAGHSLAAGIPVNLLAHVEKSYFMNRPEIRLRIVDILPAEA